jgi:hypothetical protein
MTGACAWGPWTTAPHHRGIAHGHCAAHSGRICALRSTGALADSDRWHHHRRTAGALAATPLDLLSAVAQRARLGSQLWYNLMGVVKLQDSALDVTHIECVAVQASLDAAWRELLKQRDMVPLAWDCPLDAEQRWLAHCRAWMGAMM